MAKATRIEKPFSGLFDQTVNVGDKVIVVTTSTGFTRVHKGTYVGYIESTGETKRAQVQIETERTFHIKPDGNVFDWYKDYNYRTWEEDKKTLKTEVRPYSYITTLQRNRIARIES